MASALQIVALLAACTFGFLTNWQTGGLVTSGAVFLVGVAAERGGS